MKYPKDKVLEQKIALQTEAEKCHAGFNNRSTVSLAMGLGKSKVAINRIQAVFKKKPKANIIFCGARELYLENFKKELIKFKLKKFIPKITFSCTQSLEKYKMNVFDLVIVDESHMLVNMYLEFIEFQYKLNSNIEILCLTGTPIKNNIRLNKLVPISIYKSMDESIENDFLNEYEIKVVYHDLDTAKNVHIKTASYDFYTSESESYKRVYRKYIDTSYDEEGVWKKQAFSREGQFLKSFFKNLQSKKQEALRLLELHKEDKSLVYAGSIPQANTFGGLIYHSKVAKEPRKVAYNSFCKLTKGKLINVDGIKEAVTIPGLNIGIIMHCGSSENNLEQIVGKQICSL